MKMFASPKSRLVVLGALAVTLASVVAVAQHGPAHAPISGSHPHGAMHQHASAPAVVPTMPGQDAFGTIQEIVRILEADPTTDWSKVTLAALREHLIDMNEVTLKAAAAERTVDGGIAIAVTGNGRTLDAIRRMIPAHARELDQLPGWRARTEALPDGIQLTVTSTDPKEVARIRGLGFIGLLVSGGHHQPHHLMMARGQHFH
jgi:hypothetical protein